MESPAQLSFLPDDYLATKRQRRTNAICALLFVAVIGGIASAFALTQRALRDVEHQHADVERRYTEAAKRIEQVRHMQEKQRRMAHQAELTASLLEKVPRSYLLADITNALPGGVSLIDFTLESRKRVTVKETKSQTAMDARKKAEAAKKNSASALPDLPEPKLMDVSMKVTGSAPTDIEVAAFIKRLGDSPVFKEVNLLVSDQFKRNGASGPDAPTTSLPQRRFVLELLLNGDTRVTAVDVQKQKATAAVELGKWAAELNK